MDIKIITEYSIYETKEAEYEELLIRLNDRRYIDLIYDDIIHSYDYSSKPGTCIYTMLFKDAEFKYEWKPISITDIINNIQTISLSIVEVDMCDDCIFNTLQSCVVIQDDKEFNLI